MNEIIKKTVMVTFTCNYIINVIHQYYVASIQLYACVTPPAMILQISPTPSHTHRAKSISTGYRSPGTRSNTPRKQDGYQKMRLIDLLATTSISQNPAILKR